VSRKHKYSLKPIRQNYTYAVDEIAELYGIAPDTVFRWIKNEGLVRILNSKKYFVHSSELLKFLEKRSNKNKKPCGEGEIYCCKCRKPQKPKPGSIISKQNPNKTIQISGKCSVCSTRINSIVSGNKWSKQHPFHTDTNATKKQHNGEHESPRKCQTKEGEQLCLNITR